MTGVVLLDDEQQRALRRERGASHDSARVLYRAQQPGRARQTPKGDLTVLFEPRTDFTTRSQSQRDVGVRPSAATSILTDKVSKEDLAMSGRLDSSYPMLRDSRTRLSSGELDGDDSSRGAAYAGTRSGLKVSIPFILAGLVIGLGLGLLLSDRKVSIVAAQWVSLPGELFLRALKCVVVPYVFCSVAVAVGDIVFVGKVSIVGRQTAKIYAIFWVASVAVGVATALLFRSVFKQSAGLPVPRRGELLMCTNQEFLNVLPNGTVTCSGDRTSSTSLFRMNDVNNVYKKSSDEVIARLTLSEEIMQVINTLVSKNIFTSLAQVELLSIITFAMLLGSIAGRNYFTKTRHVNYVYLTLLQLRNTFFLMMEWIIWLSPGAVISIVAGSFATHDDVIQEFRDTGSYMAAVWVAGLTQTLIVFPFIVFIMTQCNPYAYMKKMLRAYIFAFACSSSIATAPVTLACVKKARTCSQSLTNFVISIGVSSSLTGMGFYVPVAVVYLAESSGNGDDLTWLRIVGIAVISLVACAGTAPIPAAGIVTISTAYTTLFGELPPTFGFIIAADFVVDRVCTVCNVNDDLMALKVIAENTDETVAQDRLGERF